MIFLRKYKRYTTMHYKRNDYCFGLLDYWVIESTSFYNNNMYFRYLTYFDGSIVIGASGFTIKCTKGNYKDKYDVDLKYPNNTVFNFFITDTPLINITITKNIQNKSYDTFHVMKRSKFDKILDLLKLIYNRNTT